MNIAFALKLVCIASCLNLISCAAPAESTDKPETTTQPTSRQVPRLEAVAAPKPIGRHITMATTIAAAKRACPSISTSREFEALVRSESTAERDKVFSFLILCSDSPADGWAYFQATSRSAEDVMKRFRRSNWISFYSENSTKVGYSDEGISDPGDVSLMPPPNPNIGSPDRATMIREREKALARAKPPLIRPQLKNLVPAGYVWPDGSPITHAQISIILLTDIIARSKSFADYLPSLIAKYGRTDLQEIGRIPLAFAQREPELLALVEKHAAINASRIEAKAKRPPASFEAIERKFRESSGGVPDLNGLMDVYGPVSPLDPSSTCAAAIFESIAKLARNHETMVLRPRGADLNYFKDQYRYLFDATNIARLNAAPEMDFDEFKVTDSDGTKRARAVAIVPNSNCTAAYVRMIYFGALTSWEKYYAISSARIDSTFLQGSKNGRVTQQMYRVEGFSDESGRPQDFDYTCNAEVCQRRK